MLDAYHAVDDQYDDKSPDELIELTQERLSNELTGDICYLELKHALEKKGRVQPVLVTVNGEDPFKNLKTARLKKILGKNSEELFNAVNPCTVDYDKFADLMQGVLWHDISEADAREKMRAAEERPEGKELLQHLQALLQSAMPSPKQDS